MGNVWDKIIARTGDGRELRVVFGSDPLPGIPHPAILTEEDVVRNAEIFDVPSDLALAGKTVDELRSR